MVQDARTVGVFEFRCWNLSWITQAQPPVHLEELADTCGDNALFVGIVGWHPCRVSGFDRGCMLSLYLLAECHVGMPLIDVQVHGLFALALLMRNSSRSMNEKESYNPTASTSISTMVMFSNFRLA